MCVLFSCPDQTLDFGTRIIPLDSSSSLLVSPKKKVKYWFQMVTVVNKEIRTGFQSAEFSPDSSFFFVNAVCIWKQYHGQLATTLLCYFRLQFTC